MLFGPPLVVNVRMRFTTFFQNAEITLKAGFRLAYSIDTSSRPFTAAIYLKEKFLPGRKASSFSLRLYFSPAIPERTSKNTVNVFNPESQV